MVVLVNVLALHASEFLFQAARLAARVKGFRLGVWLLQKDLSFVLLGFL